MEELHNLIKRNRIDSALDLLEQKAKNSDQKMQVVVLKKDWTAFKRDKRMGILDSRDERTRQNQLVVSILDLGNEIVSTAEVIETPTPPFNDPMPPTTKGKIFFSYAWGVNDETGQNREELVDQLYNSLEASGIDVIRDKKDLNYGELISEFMEQIGQGDLVIVFTSAKYAKSPYCMFELYEIARNSKWDQRAFTRQILPVIVEFVNFNDPMVLEEYFEYWEQTEQKWAKFMQKRVGQISLEQSKQYDKIKNINHYFGKLSSWLIDINSSNNKLLAENDFEIVKQTIIQRLEAPTI
ncbi:MAG: TIR domain-containing protein [Bacteroidota bacterium]